MPLYFLKSGYLGVGIGPGGGIEVGIGEGVVVVRNVIGALRGGAEGEEEEVVEGFGEGGGE